ncbi:hypothetical protein MGI18_13285 [Bacillus sp. OVS6]|nr:hypothetical protein MGI18_13285 [Bacillus sp. OVS6]
METQLKGIPTAKKVVQPAVRPKSKSLNKFVTISLFLAPAIIIYVIYVLYPIFSTLLYSFYEWDGVGAGTYVGLQNYVNLLSDSIFWTSLTNNTWVVLTSVFVQIPLGLIMALMLLAPIRGIRLFSGVYFFHS